VLSFLLAKKVQKESFLSLSLSLDICSVFILTTRALSLARFLFSSLPSRYIHIGAAKEREREITRHPSPSLALSFSLCVRVVPEHKKKKKKKKKRIKISVKKKSIINRLLITRMSSARPPLSMKQPMLVGSDNDDEDEEGVTTPTRLSREEVAAEAEDLASDGRAKTASILNLPFAIGSRRRSLERAETRRTKERANSGAKRAEKKNIAGERAGNTRNRTRKSESGWSI